MRWRISCIEVDKKIKPEAACFTNKLSELQVSNGTRKADCRFDDLVGLGELGDCDEPSAPGADTWLQNTLVRYRERQQQAPDEDIRKSSKLKRMTPTTSPSVSIGCNLICFRYFHKSLPHVYVALRCPQWGALPAN